MTQDLGPVAHGGAAGKKLLSVSSHCSDSHEDDSSIISDKDSGIGSYDSEIESIAASSCSSPRLLHELSDERPFGCNNFCPGDDGRQSPEFALPPKAHECSRKRSYPAAASAKGMKPYVCYTCNCGFTLVNSLRAHIRHSHPRKGILSSDYRCAYCLKSYTTVDMLHSHVQKHQAEDSPEQSRITASRMIQSNQSFCMHPTTDKPRLSVKSLAFSIDSICSDIAPKKPRTAQITHLHTAEAFPSTRRQSMPALSPGHEFAMYKKDYFSRNAPLTRFPTSPSHLGSRYSHQVAMPPFFIH